MLHLGSDVYYLKHQQLRYSKTNCKVLHPWRASLCRRWSRKRLEHRGFHLGRLWCVAEKWVLRGPANTPVHAVSVFLAPEWEEDGVRVHSFSFLLSVLMTRENVKESSASRSPLCASFSLQRGRRDTCPADARPLLLAEKPGRIRLQWRAIKMNEITRRRFFCYCRHECCRHAPTGAGNGTRFIDNSGRGEWPAHAGGLRRSLL